jgi:small-conductance mechanosensitive channel
VAWCTRLIAALALLCLAPGEDAPPLTTAIAVERLDLDAREAALVAQHDHTLDLLEQAGTLTPAARSALAENLRLERELLSRMRAALPQ